MLPHNPQSPTKYRTPITSQPSCYYNPAWCPPFEPQVLSPLDPSLHDLRLFLRLHKKAELQATQVIMVRSTPSSPRICTRHCWSLNIRVEFF
ncbi:hypothetical protein K435DRAFT_776708 [Dendrothele bispora CBS 962.96]|uniref:Uncharacterized protein n=1 Tax=Dendrothele bispora (strain CBS 962.96) TaxID=1314807 RepID=A0A4S8MDK7_DENBC|nr:hypothetical protein K435DRAFT_776708 [Dendrothele bispora CBS 962.96]